MRKILSKAEINRANKRKQIILGVVLISLLVVSTAGFSWLSKDEEKKENIMTEKGIEFYDLNGIWQIRLNKQLFYFSYLPSEIENISIKGNYNLEEYFNKPFYFNVLEEGTIEILSNLEPYFLRAQKACVDEFCDDDVPVKNCSDNFVIFIEGENKVFREENCVYIVGEQKKGADAFLYKVLNIV